MERISLRSIPETPPKFIRQHLRPLMVALGGATLWALSACAPANPHVDIKITSPQNGANVATSTDISGTINVNLPPGDSIWIVLRGQGDQHLHPQSEQDQNGKNLFSFLDAPPKHWLLTSAVFGYPGNANQDVKFDVNAVLADPSATSAFKKYLQDGATTGNFPGLLELPSGAQIEDTVSVTRLKSP